MELAEGELAFAPIIAALRGVMEDGGSLEGLEDPLRSALAALWPVAGAGGSMAGGREQLFEAVYRVLVRLAEERVVALIVEDVHWIDPSSRDLLAFLVRNARRDRIAVVATYRPDELGNGHPLTPFVAELERSGRAERVELEPLARSEVAEQLEAISGRVPTVAVLDRIFVRCEGNPFFAEELLGTAAAGGGQLPVPVRQALLLRVERLSELTRVVLGSRRSSVDRSTIACSRAWSGSAIGSCLPRCGRRPITTCWSRARAAPLIRSATRCCVKRSTRTCWSVSGCTGRSPRPWTRIVSTPWLEPRRSSPITGLRLVRNARLLVRVSRPPAMPSECTRTARLPRTSTARLSCGIGWSPPDDAAGCGRLDLLLRGSEFADFGGYPAHGLALAEQARAAIDEHADPLLAAAAEARIGRSLHFSGRGVEAVDHLAAARRLVPSEPPSIAYAQALAFEGRALMLNEKASEGQRRLQEGLRIAEHLGARKVQASAMNSLAIVFGDLGEFEQAIAAGRDGLWIAKESGSVEEIMRAYINGKPGDRRCRQRGGSAGAWGGGNRDRRPARDEPGRRRSAALPGRVAPGATGSLCRGGADRA